MRAHLFFPFFDFGYFPLFHLFGLLLLLLFERVVLGEEAGERRKGHGVALAFIVFIWPEKETRYVLQEKQKRKVTCN